MNINFKDNNDLIKPPEKSNQVELCKEIIRHRRSCRSFQDKPIPTADLLELVEAGVYAPSGSNAQNQRFLIIDNQAEIQRIGKFRWVWPYKSTISQSKRREKNPSGILGNAAALIFVFADSALSDQRNNGEYYIWESLEIQNCAASIQNILLLATAKGIGSCWVSCSENMNYSRLLSNSTWQHILQSYNISEYYKIQGAILLGYPKHYDDEGFPKGEKIHGVVQSLTTRKELSHYLILKKNVEDHKNLDLSFIDTAKLRLYRRLVRGLLVVVKKVNQLIFRLENPRN